MNESSLFTTSIVEVDEEQGLCKTGSIYSGTIPHLNPYEGYSLLQNMLLKEDTRNEAFDIGARLFRESVKSSDPSWFRTVLVLRERALDRIMWPLLACTVNAFVWQILSRTGVIDKLHTESAFVSAAGYLQTSVFSTALGFLLVFRLNRASVRWWECRTMWGMVVAYMRVLAAGICEHLAHSPIQRDQAVAWTAAFGVASKQMLRGEPNNISQAELAGVLSADDVKRLQAANHPPIYCCDEVRHAIQRAFRANFDKNSKASNYIIANSISWNSISRSLENYADALVINIGGMERIRATPLPMAYTSHLRTVLLLYLFFLPYLIGFSWGYFTVPTVFITSFSLLGIDAAASECECPFQNRTNHLDMDTYCLNSLKNIMHIMIHAAEREQRDKELNDKSNETKPCMG